MLLMEKNGQIKKKLQNYFTDLMFGHPFDGCHGEVKNDGQHFVNSQISLAPNLWAGFRLFYIIKRQV